MQLLSPLCVLGGGGCCALLPGLPTCAVRMQRQQCTITQHLTYTQVDPSSRLRLVSHVWEGCSNLLQHVHT